MRKFLIGFLLLLSSLAVAEETAPWWVCLARTPVLQRVFSGDGATEAEARAAALDKCQRRTLFGCYVARCDEEIVPVDTN